LFFDAPMAYAALNLQGEVISVNRAWLALFGCHAAQKAQGRPMAQWFVSEDAEVFGQALAQVQSGQALANLTLRLKAAESVEPRVLLCQGGLSMQADDSLSRIHCVFTDLTEQQRNALALQQAASVFEYTTEGIMITDAQGRIVSVNPAFTSILGYSAQEVVGEYPSKLKSGRHSPAFYQTIWQALAQQGHWSGEIWNRRKSGELIAEWLSIATIYDQNGKVKHYVGIFADISRLKQSEKQMLRMANQDHLTGLPNRRHFLTRLQHALETAQRKHTRLAVIMLDVDRFKGVNDSYGHEVGDALLKTLADIFEQACRSSEMVARLGGDEFAFLLEDIAQPEDAGRVASQLLARLGEPITLSNGVEVMLSATAGISLFPDLAQLPEQLLQQADTALYRAKAEGSGQFFYFTQSMTFQAQERLILEAQLKQALKQNQFVVFYQPKVEVETGRIIGAEALVRWQHPDLGLLSPNAFIEVCEETGLVVALGEWVLQEACRQGRAWQQRWGDDFHLAVNVAASQWQQLQWVDTVERVLKSTPYPAQNLELEITENSLLRAQEHVLSSLARLHALGVRIAIDDFGTGYSSLSYLKRLPIHSLKIDRSFVEDLEVNQHDRQLVQAMVAMAHSLGLTVVCEGIENAAQLAFIKQQACEFYQGFYMSAPLSAAQFEQFMQQGNRGNTQ
jgi:diguanylate cyclase (GGDEF)-like protein/PAS domain S-box-containing protein